MDGLPPPRKFQKTPSLLDKSNFDSVTPASGHSTFQLTAGFPLFYLSPLVFYETPFLRLLVSCPPAFVFSSR